MFENNYVLFWDDIRIGNIRREDGLFMLDTNPDALKSLGNKGMLGSMLSNPILPTFLKDRLFSDINCINECRCATDKFSIKKM